MQALPGGAAHLAELTLRPLRGKPAALRWQQLGASLGRLQSLALTADVSRAGPAASLGLLTALTRLRLAGPLNVRPQPNVLPALLACAAPGLARLELARVRALDLQPLLGAPLPPPLVDSDSNSDGGEEQPGLHDDGASIGSASDDASEAGDPVLPALMAEDGGLDEPPGLASSDGSSDEEGGPPPLDLDDLDEPWLTPPTPGSVGARLASRWPRLEHVRLHDCVDIDDSLLCGGLLQVPLFVARQGESLLGGHSAAYCAPPVLLNCLLT